MDECENKRVVYLENVHLIFFPFLPCKQFHFHTLKNANIWCCWYAFSYKLNKSFTARLRESRIEVVINFNTPTLRFFAFSCKFFKKINEDVIYLLNSRCCERSHRWRNFSCAGRKFVEIFITNGNWAKELIYVEMAYK